MNGERKRTTNFHNRTAVKDFDADFDRGNPKSGTARTGYGRAKSR